MQKVNLDLVPEGVNPIVYASQNDDKRTIRFELVVSSFGGSWTLSGNETITAKITKPDGTTITIPITNPGSGKHYVDLVNGVSDYDQDGVYLGEISFTDGDETIGSGNFVLKVEADPYDGSVQKKIVIDNPATFSTSLPDVLVSCKCKIDDANGIDSMDVINAGPTYARDSVPYQFRATPITANRTLEKLIGVSCAFNQLVNIPSSSKSKTENGVTFTDNRDGTYTVQTDANGATNNTYISLDNFGAILNHKYYQCGCPTGGSDNKYYFYSNGFINTIREYGNGMIGNQQETRTCTPVIYIKSGAIITTPIVFKPQVIDLTAMFGSEVADYLYNLENS